MQLEKGTVQRTAQAVAEKMEKDRLYRELNAHTIGLNFIYIYLFTARSLGFFNNFLLGYYEKKKYYKKN